MFKACVNYKYREFETLKEAMDFIKDNMYISDKDYQKAFDDFNKGLNSLDFVYGFTTGFVEEIEE